MLRILGWLGWLGHCLLASLMLAAAAGTASREGAGVLLLAAVAAALIPTLVMMVHLDRNPELREVDQRLWRALLLWLGPIAGAAYLTVADRRLSESSIGWILRMFLD